MGKGGGVLRNEVVTVSESFPGFVRQDINHTPCAVQRMMANTLYKMA